MGWKNLIQRLEQLYISIIKKGWKKLIKPDKKITVMIGGNWTIDQLIKVPDVYDHVYDGIDWSKIEVRQSPRQFVRFQRFNVKRGFFMDEVVMAVQDYAKDHKSVIINPGIDEVLFFGRQFSKIDWKRPQLFPHAPILSTGKRAHPHFLVLFHTCLSGSQSDSGRQFHELCQVNFRIRQTTWLIILNKLLCFIDQVKNR
jgi:hypothetical protein